MKYRVKNTVTGEETICGKVVVDNYDYYVNDEVAKDGDKLYLIRDCLFGKIGDIINNSKRFK